MHPCEPWPTGFEVQSTAVVAVLTLVTAGLCCAGFASNAIQPDGMLAANCASWPLWIVATKLVSTPGNTDAVAALQSSTVMMAAQLGVAEHTPEVILTYGSVAGGGGGGGGGGGAITVPAAHLQMHPCEPWLAGFEVQSTAVVAVLTLVKAGLPV